MDTIKKRHPSFVWAAVLAVAIVLLSISSASGQDAGPEALAVGPEGAGAEGAGADKGADAETGEARKDADQPKPGYFKELHIRNVEIRGALEMLNSQVKKNIVTTPEVTGKVTADLYEVTFAEALDGILRANGLAYTAQGNFIYVMTTEQKTKLTQVDRKLSTKMFRLSYVNAADVRALITPLMSENGKISLTPAAASGIATSTSDAGGNSFAASDMLVVSDYDDNIRRITTVIDGMDVKPDQVLIEAVLLRAGLTENNSLGVDFNVLSGIDFNTLGATTSGLQAQPAIPAPVAANVGHQAWTFRTDNNGAIPAGGLTFGFMSNNVGVFVRALEGITDVTVMANPKLLIVNKQRGEVMVGNKDGYLTTTFTETTASQTVEFLQTGTTLVVRPFIGRDDYVRLEIHPKDSSGTVAVVGTSALPSETTTEVTSNVLVRDGHTIVIGGLFRENITARRVQTPLLGNVPYLGALFRSTADTTVREEVIILVTPRIIRQGADEAVGEQIKDDVERFRLGARKGIRWWGRSRLAQGQVRYARSAMADGKRDRALWHLDCALSLRPDLIGAIHLKERLTNRAYWADVTRESSARFIIQRMIMNDLGKPTDRVIPHRKPLDGKGLSDEVKKAFGIAPSVQDPLELAPPDDDDAADGDGGDDGDQADATAGDDPGKAADQPDAAAGDDPGKAADQPDAAAGDDPGEAADQADAAAGDDPGDEADQAMDGQDGENQDNEVGVGESDGGGDLAADDATDDGS